MWRLLRVRAPSPSGAARDDTLSIRWPRRAFTSLARLPATLTLSVALPPKLESLLKLIRSLTNILDSLAATIQKGGRLRHPTFQRIFGRAEVSPWGWTFAGTPLYAIARSNMEHRVSRTESALGRASFGQFLVPRGLGTMADNRQ